MKKDYISLICAIVMAGQCAWGADITVGGLNYNLLDAGAGTCALAAGEYKGDLVIPDEIEFKGRTLKVVSVENEALYNLPELVSVSIGKNVETFGNYSFTGCTALEKLVIPANVDGFGSFSFRNCGIRELEIEPGEGSLYFGTSDYDYSPAYYYSTFEKCPNLEKVTICRSIWIHDTEDRIYSKLRSPFKKCTSIKEVVCDMEYMESEMNLFQDCTSLEKVTFGPSLHGISGSAFSRCDIKDIVIPGNVEYLGTNAFEDNKNLQTLVLGEGVKRIEGFCFSNCGEGVKTLVVPSTVEDGYFRGLDGVKDLTVNTNGTLTLDGKQLEIVRYGANVETLNPGLLGLAADLREIHVGALEPPLTYKNYGFTPQQYLNTTLYVPFQSVEKYKEANIWKNFWGIEGEEYVGGVEGVLNDANLMVNVSGNTLAVESVTGSECAVYNASGSVLGRGRALEVSGLTAGVYIVTDGIATRKIMIR